MSASVPPPGYVPQASAPASRAPHAETRFAASRMLIAGLILVVAVVAAFVVLGSAGTPASNPIARAATLSSSTPGYRIRLGLQLSSPALPGPITASGSGVVDLRDQAASMSLAIDVSAIPQLAQTLGSTTMQMAVIKEGSTFYVHLPLAAAIPGLAGKPWLKMDLGKLSGLGLGAFQSDPSMSDPSRMLEFLRGTSDSVINLGLERVDGVPATHYRAQLSFDRLADRLPEGERKGLGQLLAKLQAHDFPIDVWVDAHRLVRRIAISLTLSAAGSQPLQESVTADVGHYGVQRRPAAPPADQVQDGGALLGAGARTP